MVSPVPVRSSSQMPPPALVSARRRRRSLSSDCAEAASWPFQALRNTKKMSSAEAATNAHPL